MPTFDQFGDAMRRNGASAREAERTLSGRALPEYVRRMRQATAETNNLTTGLRNLAREHRNAENAAEQHRKRLRDLENQQKELQRQYRLLRNAGIGAYAGLTGLAMGLVRTGLQGTVEGYRMEYAWTRLGRSVAAIALPAFEKMADWMGRIAGWFERLSGRQQDFILKLGLVAVAAGPVIMALKMIRSLAGAAFAVGSFLAGGGSMATLTGAAAGVAGTGAGAAGAAAAGGGLLSRAGGFGRFARMAAPVGLAVAGGVALAESGGLRLNASEGPTDQYARLRRSGRSRLGAGFEVAGTAMGFLGRELFGGEEEFIEGGARKKRRDVQAMGFASEEAGGAHFRIQEELLKVSVAKAEERAKAMEDEAAARAKLIEQMEREAAVRGFTKASGLPGFVGVGVDAIGGLSRGETSDAILGMFDSDRLKKIMGK